MIKIKKKILTACFVLIFLAVAVFPAAAMEITSELKEVINTDIVEDAVPDSAREIIVLKLT